MNTFEDDVGPKRKRRRKEIPPPVISARLIFDDSLKNHAASLSSRLVSVLGFGMYILKQIEIRSD